jgi:hypothetical protein
MTGARVRTFVTSVLCFVSLFAVAAQVPRDNPGVRTGAGVISGVVSSDETNSQPLRHVTVSLASGELSLPRTTVTDEQGRFAFVGLAAGNYTLIASRPGYVAAFYGAKKPGRSRVRPSATSRSACCTAASSRASCGTRADNRPPASTSRSCNCRRSTASGACRRTRWPRWRRSPAEDRPPTIAASTACSGSRRATTWCRRRSAVCWRRGPPKRGRSRPPKCNGRRERRRRQAPRRVRRHRRSRRRRSPARW